MRQIRQVNFERLFSKSGLETDFHDFINLKGFYLLRLPLTKNAFEFKYLVDYF